MRVLSVSNFFDTHGGGLERVAGHLSREFVLAGHHAAWAACDADGAPDNPAELIGLRCANPIEAFTGLPMPVPGPQGIAALARAVRASDVIVIHDALYVPSILAMLFAKLHRRPVVLIQHIADIPFKSRIARAILRIANATITRSMMSIANRLVFISQTVRDDLLGSPPRIPSKLIFNGVEQSIFNLRSEFSPQAVRKQWNLPESVFLAVFVGRFVEKKGLSIIKALAQRRVDIHFALIGKGPIRPEEWGLRNVHVMGQQDQEVVADLYRAGDALLLPSVGEGYPLVVQEAMACGLPVVCGAASARADPDASKWLHGVSVDLSDPDESAASCEEALTRLKVSRVDSKAMAEYAAKAYDWGTMAKAVLDGLASKQG